MYNLKVKPPHVFVNFRRVKLDNKIIGLFIHTYDEVKDELIIFDTDKLTEVSKSFILDCTEKVSRHECDEVYQTILTGYHLYHDGRECEIRCTPLLPRQFI